MGTGWFCGADQKYFLGCSFMELQNFGVLALVPSLLVFALAIWTKRPIESLLCGSLLGLMMLHGLDFVSELADTSLRVLTDEDVAWVILVCGLMGSLIALLIRTGGATAFTASLQRWVKSRKSALFTSWGLGLIMFVDDYLNSLAVGAAMRDLTDKFRISREKLAYVVDSTAAPISVIIPYSTWGAFFGGLLVANGLAEEGQGLDVYISAIPYMLYAWIAVLIVPLVIYGVIPAVGGMKKAEARAMNEGLMIPPSMEGAREPSVNIKPKSGIKPRAGLFVLPMIALVATTIWFDNDFLIGVFITLGGMVLAILAMRILDLHDTCDTVLDGFKTMIEPLAVLVAAFILKDVNDALGLPAYVVASLDPVLTPELLPAVIFVSMGLVSFMTGSNWGVFVIILPIVTSLGQQMDADMTLLIGATLSASTFGSHACFYSDSTVLSAQATGCSPLQHALTQLPYVLLAAALTVMGYLALGYL
jgi:Na+/H+ antiporter NhaC